VADGETLDAGAATWSVQIPQFEGPLDLLLHLCQKHELNVLDIPIGLVTEKYLEYLAIMQLMELDVAAEYLVMAATLAHIKSKMLLPSPPPGQEDEATDDEEEMDPREALIRRLLEYQKYKLAGEQLAARGVAGRDVFGRGMPLEEAANAGKGALAPLAEVPIFSLVEAFQRVLDKSKIKLSHDIVADRLSLSDRIGQLSDLLSVRKRVAFESLFEGMTTKFDLVITFLALLEMTRLRMTRLFQSEPLGPLHVELAALDPEDEGAERTWDAQAREPSASGGPVEPRRPAEPGESDEPDDAVGRSEPGDPDEPSEPDEPGEPPAQPAGRAIEPGEPAAPEAEDEDEST
jgi:segregation and condensation protein A